MKGDHISTSISVSRKASSNTTPNVARGRIYRTVVSGQTKWVTRDLAALDFLLGIPMEKESTLVHSGWQRNQQPAQGKWWEKLIHQTPGVPRRVSGDNNILEQPDSQSVDKTNDRTVVTGGRSLDGDEATKVAIPRTGFAMTRQRSIARQAEIREWELQVAHGLQDEKSYGLLDGRVFFSSKENYPISVFSVIRYEPKREEAARLRQKLEARGGGGTQFVVPERDWRGTSYRALLVRHEKKNKKFNRFIGPETEADESDVSSSSSEGGDAYVPGFLDDPDMVQGRNRNVVIGDRVTGCIVSSTIQFVKPADLKADLNKQFRERFDGWEPPKSLLKFIAAKVVDGVYTLADPKDVTDGHDDHEIKMHEPMRRPRLGSIPSPAETKETIRMPPSLTLSKIRSIKQQALKAAVKARLEVSTVALACVYFERLCLDCRVDKSNRRLCFAACLLLAAKINEANVVGLVTRNQEENTKEKSGIQSLIRPTQKSNTIFASLLEFMTQDWSLSLKHLFSAEWGVFAALGFELHATPSQVSFHFRRLMKVLEWQALSYLGSDMYSQWQDCLLKEETRRQEREQRREIRRARNERKLLKMEFKLKQESEKNQHAIKFR